MGGVRNCTRCLSNLSVQAANPRQSLYLASSKVARPVYLQPLHGKALSTSTSTQSSNNSATPEPGPKFKTKRRRGPFVYSIGAATVLTAAWYAFASGSKDESLNDTRFTAFDVVSNEPVSPTAFVLTIRSRDSALAKNSAKLKAAWEHGLWSVEFKQPQLQIARHYTPLPPLEGEDGTEGQLRFLVRKMQGGEMSNYLSRMHVGDQVWLRGPHHGFDIPKRLGDAREIVFLAGGTGIAPALQMVHKMLNAPVNGAEDSKPSIRILWANRRSVDCVARDEFRSKREETHGTQSVFLRQILEMKRRHGDQFSIDYFVDDEKKFIGIKDIEAALRSTSATKTTTWTLQPANKSCRWHSDKLLAASMDEDDGDTPDAACACPQGRAGRKIVCVSGPDGFIEAFAGPKRWTGGRELQGPVQGALGTIKQQRKGTVDNWLVLKL